jgi:hypothetical protein
MTAHGRRNATLLALVFCVIAVLCFLARGAAALPGNYVRGDNGPWTGTATRMDGSVAYFDAQAQLGIDYDTRAVSSQNEMAYYIWEHYGGVPSHLDSRSPTHLEATIVAPTGSLDGVDWMNFPTYRVQGGTLAGQWEHNSTSTGYVVNPHLYVSLDEYGTIIPGWPATHTALHNQFMLNWAQLYGRFDWTGNYAVGPPESWEPGYIEMPLDHSFDQGGNV